MAGPSSSGDARPAYPAVWRKEQYEEFKRKNVWLYVQDGKLGCTSCRDVKNLGVMASHGVSIAVQWAEGKIAPYGSTRDAQLTALRKKYLNMQHPKHTMKQARSSRQPKKMS